ATGPGGKMSRHRRAPALDDVTVGVVGADTFLHRVAEVARTEVRAPYRLVTASDAGTGGSYGQALRIAKVVDVLLFSGPLPYDLAMAGEPLPVPAKIGRAAWRERGRGAGGARAC